MRTEKLLRCKVAVSLALRPRLRLGLAGRAHFESHPRKMDGDMADPRVADTDRELIVVEKFERTDDSILPMVGRADLDPAAQTRVFAVWLRRAWRCRFARPCDVQRILGRHRTWPAMPDIADPFHPGREGSQRGELMGQSLASVGHEP